VSWSKKERFERSFERIQKRELFACFEERMKTLKLSGPGERRKEVRHDGVEVVLVGGRKEVELELRTEATGFEALEIRKG